MRFFEITLSQRAGRFWCPPAPSSPSEAELDTRVFTEAVPYDDVAPLVLPATEGEPAHFALGDFLVPVVDRATRDVVVSLDDQVQVIALSTEHGEYWDRERAAERGLYRRGGFGVSAFYAD